MVEIDLSEIPNYQSKKNYSHFDCRVSFRDVERKVLDPNYIEQHAFYPLISNTLCQVRFRDGSKSLKTRDVAYAAHFDHRVFQYYALLWGRQYDLRAASSGIQDVAVAYRKGLGLTNVSAAADAIGAIRKLDDTLVVTGDFTHFFDNLDHAYLRKAVRGFFEDEGLPNDHYQVLKNILHYSHWPIGDLVQRNGLDWVFLRPDDPATFSHKAELTRGKALRELNNLPRILSPEIFAENKRSAIVVPWKAGTGSAKGIPQGLAASGVLANMYMFDIDLKINNCVSGVGGRYIRYCDDFLIVVPISNHANARDALQLARQTPGVELQPEKTKVFHVFDGQVEQLSFDAFFAGELEPLARTAHPKHCVSFLGFDFDGKNVMIRQSTVGRFYNRFYRAAKSIGRLADDPTRHPSKKRVCALYEHYSPKGKKGSTKRGSSKQRKYGNYLSYVDRAQKAFPDDPIDKHVSKMYRKINRATGRV